MHTAEAELLLKVVARDEVAVGVVSLTLGPVEGELPGWSPGSHIDLVLNDDTVRQYSLCGPVTAPTWRVAVLLEPEGRGGSALVHASLHVGDTVRARGPRNHFELLPAQRYLFIAGGIGITPLAPMIAASQAAEWQLLYGGRSRASMALLPELEGFGERVVLRPQDEYGLLDLEAALATATADTRIYCCGPEPLLTAVEALHSAAPIGTLHVERFAAKSLDFDPDRAFDVVLARSGLTVSVEPGQPVLTAIAAAGVDVMYSCEEGICGTCESRVLAGIPDHRDSILTPEEQATNDLMMICVSRSKTATLTLDL